MNEELEEAINNVKGIIETFYEFPNPNSILIRDYEVNDIETVLKELERLQEENRQYKRIKDIKDSVTKEEIEEAIKRADKEFIAKDKIKEKLEDLKSQYKKASEENSIKAFILKCQIKILEKLLEEK